MPAPDLTPRTYRFTDGSTRTLAHDDAMTVLGLDAEGYVVVRWSESTGFTMEYALTACCQASAKGCDGYIGCRACYAEVDPKLGGDPDPVTATVVPDAPPPKEKRMSRTKSVSAAEQFAALGLTDASKWTPAMNLAVKQKWSSLPVDAKVDDLRTRLAAVKTPAVPSIHALTQQLGTADAAKAEHARLLRNAKVNAWRARNQIQAALDAREMKFAARAKRTVAA